MKKTKKLQKVKLDSNTTTALIAFIIGVLFTGFVAGRSVNSNNTSIMNLMGINTVPSPVESSKQKDDVEMSAEVLEGLTGNNFDREFIAHMIHHHKDAIDSAKLVEKNSQRPELAEFAKKIQETQANEVEQLKKWQTDWRLADPNSNAHYH